MKNHKILSIPNLKLASRILLVFLAVSLVLGSGTNVQAMNNTVSGNMQSSAAVGKIQQTMSSMQHMITPADRKAAALVALGANGGVAAPVNTAMDPLGTPDYFGSIPNFANSPLPELDTSGNVISGTGIRKFVDALPGLGITGKNGLGQYIPVAIPDTTTYPGSDYYEISLVEYSEQMHSDLPPTKLRGYVQTNTNDPTIKKPNYLGPVIVAQKDRPVRVKFTNKLPTGSGGDLFIPVDTTVMGAGMGPNGGTEMYTQNRATLHLHGGITPWISDGTPHQWITPAGENTSYPKGVSVQNVPDMPDPGPGSQTFIYTNQQSARLMFYHDHSYGITRLNVYAGEAAGYILSDDTEKSLIANGIIPSDQIPLIIQDKTFVPKDAQLAAQDPTWSIAKWGGFGSLWFPHVYMPNQNPYNITGANPMGRWDYGPWFWPPYTGLKNGPVPNPLAGVNGEPPYNPGTPNPSIVPEGFMDTPVINGTAYPYLNLEPKAYRFRILNASNDRFWNLQLYTAKSNNKMWNGTTLLDANAGEVPMVPAVATPGYPGTWPTDGRAGGVPDPSAAGPKMIQIGTEGGFLPQAVELPNQPIDYVYNRRDIVVLNVSNKTLFLGPAERADVVIDFSKYAGKTLILYNDAPAPVPAFDPRYDYYTGDPDQTDTGGAPSTLPGYGPNTRTIMQIHVAAAVTPADGTPAALPPVSKINLINGGSGYSAPKVSITGGGGTGAAATATGSIDKIDLFSLGNGFSPVPTISITDTQGGTGSGAQATATVTVNGIKLTAGGSGYLTAPSVTISDSTGNGTGAAAKATLTITEATIASGGTVYTSPPDVTITDAGGTGSGAAAAATLNPDGTLAAISITSGGSGYTSPKASLAGGGVASSADSVTLFSSVDNVALTSTGSGYKSPVTAITGGLSSVGTAATAVATSSIDGIKLISGGNGYTAPIVTITGGDPGVPAIARVTMKITSVSLTNGGSGYSSVPTVTITDKFPGGGSGALAEAALPDGIAFNQAPLFSEMPAAFKASQDPLIVPDGTNPSEPPAYAKIQDTQLTFTPPGGTTPMTLNMEPKAIQELFEPDYGRMNAVLGVEIPNTSATIQTTIPYKYIDPTTETMQDSVVAAAPTAGDGTQIWKITHNGVDTHAIHFHLFNVQVVNRVGWDGAIRLPDPNELGWKDTVRMNPLEDIIIAIRPVAPKSVFGIPDSIRPLDVTAPVGSTGQFTGINPNGNPVNVVNQLVNLGWEYVWHCHLLGHEENDMMRPIKFNVARVLPTAPILNLARTAAPVALSWTDATPPDQASTLGNPANEIGFRVMRASIGNNGKPGAYTQVGTALANATVYIDNTASLTTAYSYKVIAYNAAGDSTSAPVTAYAIIPVPNAPTNLTAALQAGPQAVLAWTDNSTSETGFTVQRSVNGSPSFSTIATVGPKAGTGNVSYTDTTITTGNSYTYRVNAVNAGGASVFTNTATIAVPSVPSAPKGLSVTAARAGTNSDTVTLSWTDTSNNETGFTLQRATNSTFTAGVSNVTIPANTNTIQQTGVKRNTTYWYRINSNNIGGNSAWSNVVSITTP